MRGSSDWCVIEEYGQTLIDWRLSFKDAVEVLEQYQEDDPEGKYEICKITTRKKGKKIGKR